MMFCGGAMAASASAITRCRSAQKPPIPALRHLNIIGDNPTFSMA
jgi:hypothetical protein